MRPEIAITGARRRRLVAAVAAAAATALAAAGCGVQPTGVNVAEVEPFGVTSSTSAQSASPSQDSYTVSLYLFSTINRGGGTMINRSIPAPADVTQLPNLLSQLTAEERFAQYTTYVPAGITLKPTPQGHEYYLFSPSRVGPLAQQQLTCTMDQYWIQHPDSTGLRPTTRLIIEATGEDTGWQDCEYGLTQGTAGTTPPARTPSPEVGKASPQG